MKNGDFVIFYTKNNQLYPVVINEEQNNMLQIMIAATLDNYIKIIDKPQGEVINLRDKEGV